MIFKKSSKKAGLSPGTLIHVGERKVEDIKISILEYDETDFREINVDDIEVCGHFTETDSITWINISGIHDIDMIQKLGTCFKLHPLVLEDVLNTEQRPKMDDFDDYLFLVLKMVYPDVAHQGIQYEQISFIIGPTYVISLQEVEEDVFDSVRERIRHGKGRIRRQGSDYLAYALMDMVVDQYFKILEDLGEQIETLQDAVIEDPEPSSLAVIQNLKKEILFLRKSIWPLREIINALTRGESELIRDETVIYLRDVYDHTIQIIDNIETFRDMLSGTLDIYLSNVSNRMNEVMKVLTIMATIFIPMTFVAGIYGMNFKYMPELEWVWSYPVLWLVLISMFLVMMFWFKRKKWF
jgi:magnesium transporter